MNVYRFRTPSRSRPEDALAGRSALKARSPSPRVSDPGARVLHVDFKSGEVRRSAGQPATSAGPCGCSRLGYAGTDDRHYQRLERVLEEGIRSLLACRGDAAATPHPLRSSADDRLPTASIEAPITAINLVLERRPGLRRLLEYGGVRLFALYDDGAVALRYAGALHWEPASVQDAACA